MEADKHIGNYIRTPYGIRQIKEIAKYVVYQDSWVYVDDRIITYTKEELENLKSSPNIIDLIEENDYINGSRVEKNKYGELYTSHVYYGGDIGKQCEVYTTWLEDYTEDMIETIVTKEQFNQMEYKI